MNQNGKKWVTPAFVIQMIQPEIASERPEGESVTPSEKPAEIGFTATKKLGNAVVRNRCKRRLRAICDTVLDQFEIKGHKLVLIARTDAMTRDITQLNKDLGWALRKLGLSQKGN